MTGPSGIGNSGESNTGLFNAGRLNTGVFNTGVLNTGIANPGSYNTGSFNVGSANTGSWNPGQTNTGWFNTGDYNTGWANTGDFNTGGFNRGDLNNGFFWRGDNQGQAAFDLTFTIPRIALQVDVNVPINIPVTGTLGSVLNGQPIITIPSFTIPDIARTHIGTAEVGQPRNQDAGAALRVRHSRSSGYDERRNGCRRLLQQLGEGRQCRHRRGGFGVIAEHGGDVLRPHLFVLGIHRRDRRGVQAEQVRCHERHQLRAVCQHRARIDRRRQGGLERGGRHASLPGSLPGLRTRRGEPTQIAAGHIDHRRRRRPLP
ncbi:hypothetical protein A9W98_17305 [Mycobacterium gordonae]|uniref:Pentapeptide repeat-containing protein n=1 Tax=Mycobacterium gordonae TaxID=1778 RepID=A0A1A6BI59_MYCGO|nr:hypothetical protein A9W98_17305 [Mycobacterium gordonae]